MDIKSLQKLAGVNEATVNISMTGANSAEISDLMNMFKGPEPKPISIGGPPPPPPGLDIPDIKPPIGLDKPVPMGIDGPMPPMPPPKPIGLDDGPKPCETCGGIHGDEPCGEDTSWDNGPDEKYLDADHMTNGVSGGINGRKNPKDIRVKDGSSMEQTKESMKESYKAELWKALQEKYFTEFDGRRSAVQEYPVPEEQTFSGRSDRTFFVVPNEEDYMDIQDDNRFAGDIEVPDENADIMALPNSKARKLKMMYGDKVEFLGTDYDEALAQVSQDEGYQTTPEKDLVGKQHKLPNEIKAKILAAPEDGEKDSENNSMYDEEMNDIARLAGVQKKTFEDELGAEMDAADSLETLAKEIYPGKPPAKVAAFLKNKMGEEGAKQFLLAKKAKAQGAYAKNSKPKPMPGSTDTYKGSGITSKPIKYAKQSGPKTPTVKTGAKQAAPARSNSKSTFGQDIVNRANKLLGR